WLVELDTNGCLGVGFGGGEPTLHPDFPALCQFAAAETGLAVTFTTHAHRLDEPMVETLAGSVHFVRVSVDGVGRTYERLRGRPYSTLRERLVLVRRLARFGLNVVVNRQTFPDLDALADLALEFGATEVLLLPQQPVAGLGGIDPATRDALQGWVDAYVGPIPLTVSVAGSAGLPVCDPVEKEGGLRAYTHIDAEGKLKCSSFDPSGVAVGEASLMTAVETLRTRTEGTS
ncbi:MAG: radical SAM protein, partial [Gemmataceae bacterium]